MTSAEVDVDGRTLTIRMRGLLPSLSNGERAIAEVVLENPAVAARMTISEMAASAAVSDTSVTRFCRRMGLAGYQELRLALSVAAEYERAQQQGLRGLRIGASAAVSEETDCATVVEATLAEEVRALTETADQLDLVALDAAAGALASARRIDVFGAGSSGLVSQDLQYKLHHLGLLCFTWTDPHRALMGAAQLGPGDVAVGISYSGATPEVLEPLHEASDRGARIICLTNDVLSPVAVLSDVVLGSSGRETPFRTGSTVSRVGQLLVLDCLYVRVAQRLGGTAHEALRRAQHAVASRSGRRNPPTPTPTDAPPQEGRP